jgi:dTDP-4-dehydrorhamnose 3,5-epimerase-like enzyme
MIKYPEIIKGGVHQDNRGVIKFVNDFIFHNIKRFYYVSNRSIEVIRAWQAHKYESKYFFVTSGELIIKVVKIDDWKCPSRNLKVQKFTLSENDSNILLIPSGYANGFKAKQPNSSVIIFSDRTLDESNKDDYRFEKFMWSDWSD